MAKPTNDFACEAGAQDFIAVAYREPKAGRRVTVRGTCSCNTEGFTLTLELASPPIVATPEELHLMLVETAPTGTVAQVVTPTPVEGTFPIADEIERVVIRNRGFSVPVKEE
ncbi:hypothetical protein ACH44C_16110 [Streptomyces purpureus]|uniref:hypothetical protein n=1 Tax=Streptomyces purpureus TaxID=1951 RepID=UPI00379967AC